jgi:lauroyl/myristoyl acyltransferase
MYYLLKFFQSILKNIPRKVGYSVFEFFFMIVFLFPSKRRKILKINLSNVIGHEAPKSMLREAYKCYARYYFDLHQDKEKLLQSVSITPEFQHAYTISKDLLRRYNGLIIISLHIGNWDFGASYISCNMFPGKGNSVVEKLPPPVYKWFTEIRTKWGMKVIDTAHIKTMMHVLKNGKILVLTADRDLEKTGYQMEFFGKKAYIPSGPAKLALTYNVPIMVGIMPRDRTDPLRFIPVFDPDALNLEKLEKTEENAEKLTYNLIKHMETQLRDYPEQWCMLQQVWVEK